MDTDSCSLRLCSSLALGATAALAPIAAKSSPGFANAYSELKKVISTEARANVAVPETANRLLGVCRVSSESLPDHELILTLTEGNRSDPKVHTAKAQLLKGGVPDARFSPQECGLAIEKLWVSNAQIVEQKTAFRFFFMRSSRTQYRNLFGLWFSGHLNGPSVQQTVVESDFSFWGINLKNATAVCEISL